MNLRLVSRSLGILLLLLAAGMILCFGVGALLPAASDRHSEEVAFSGWWISIALTVTAGSALIWQGRGTSGGRILRRDTIGIVGLAWFVCGLFAALPYALCETGLSLTGAWFEGVSGLTTTGATVFGDLYSLPKTILLWRSLTQWLGGMGILAMFVLVLPSLGSSGLTLFRSETSAHGQDLTGAQMVRWLWLLYVVLTLICAAGMWLLGMSAFQSINHAMTTVATAGFSTEDASFAAASFGIGLKLWTTLFMLLSGISLPLYITMHCKRSWSPIATHEETWVFMGVLAVVLGLVAGSRVDADAFAEDSVVAAVNTLFNVVSILTTTGYACSDFDLWPPLAKGLLLGCMIIGGCAGSTAGGLKVSRILLWWRLLHLEIQRVYRPNEVIVVKINGNQIPSSAMGQTFVILTTAVALTVLGSGVFLAVEPDCSAVGGVSAVIACLMNIGPAFAEFGPSRNFSGLSTASNLLLPLLMVVGRLEYLAVLALFSKNLWRRF